MTKATKIFLAVWLVLSLAVPPVDAQIELGVVMKKHYSLRSVSCNGCHCEEEEEKTCENLTPFGRVIAKLMEKDKLTERLHLMNELHDEERELVKEEIEKQFAETLKKLQVVKDPSGKTYAERIQAGEIEGLRPRP